jgi:hypothetical protein
MIAGEGSSKDAENADTIFINNKHLMNHEEDLAEPPEIQILQDHEHMAGSNTNWNHHDVQES